MVFIFLAYFTLYNDNPICKTEKETQMYRTDFCTLWEKARVGCFKRTASEHVYYLGWNRWPGQVGCMRQVLEPGALGRPRGIGWRGRWEGGSGWGIHVNPWLIHVNVWQKPLKYCKVISFQLIKINEKKFLKKSQTALTNGHSILNSHQQCMRVLDVPHYHQWLTISIFKSSFIVVDE